MDRGKSSEVDVFTDQDLSENRSRKLLRDIPEAKLDDLRVKEP
ncbi:MAG: hypothetical protein ABSA46_10440 [Thermodesulfovibrionales bacterium]|jgi:hypothetical protein